VGNPNTGKSTLFNALTGHRQRVGNYPGVTVEKRTGLLRDAETGVSILLIDLPGAYSLAAHAHDEAIVLDVLLGYRPGVEPPALIVVVVDASNLARNLFLATQILELGCPVIVALNMMDVARSSGIHVDANALAQALGVPVLPMVATKQEGVGALRRALFDALGAPPPPVPIEFPGAVQTEVRGLVDYVAGQTCEDNYELLPVEALQILLDPGGFSEQRLIRRCGPSLAEELAERRARIESAGDSIVEVEGRARYAWIDPIVERSTARGRARRRSRTELIDRVVTHRWIGLAILLVMMAVCFQSVYSWAGPLMDGVDRFFGALGEAVAGLIPEGALRSLLENGVVAGVGAVLAFLPQILILFLFIAILEDCGYMARAAFLLDRWMGPLGLCGKSFIPLLSCFACAVPGIMAARTIENRRDRFVTILLAPLMSCSARLPVYVLLIGAFVPATPLWGSPISMQAVTLWAMYLVGILFAIPAAVLLRRTILRGATTPFLMELPTYKWPSPRVVLHRVVERGCQFCATAGTIIVTVTIIVWALGYYPHPPQIAAAHDTQREAAREAHAAQLEQIARRYDASMTAAAMTKCAAIVGARDTIESNQEGDFETSRGSGPGPTTDPAGVERVPASGTVEDPVAHSGAGPEAWEAALAWYQADRALKASLAQIGRSESSAYLQQSLLGHAGRWVEPVVRPLGWDWRIGTAVIASFPAREIVVATLGTIYNLGEQQDEGSVGLRQKLRTATWPDGRPVFNLPVALSIMVFVALCCQCAATLATIKRETGSWRWPLLTFVSLTTLAYCAALVTYQVAIRLT
jgi:ferrous iron transport protein B